MKPKSSSPRAPRRPKPMHWGGYSGVDVFVGCIWIADNVITPKDGKKLLKWLQKAVAFLEYHEKKGRR